AVREGRQLVDADDAVRVQTAHRARLLNEAPARVLVPTPVVREDLERDETVELLVVREPNRRERAVAERPFEAEPFDPLICRHRIIIAGRGAVRGRCYGGRSRLATASPGPLNGARGPSDIHIWDMKTRSDGRRLIGRFAVGSLLAFLATGLTVAAVTAKAVR